MLISILINKEISYLKKDLIPWDCSKQKRRSINLYSDRFAYAQNNSKLLKIIIYQSNFR